MITSHVYVIKDNESGRVHAVCSDLASAFRVLCRCHAHIRRHGSVEEWRIDSDLQGDPERTFGLWQSFYEGGKMTKVVRGCQTNMRRAVTKHTSPHSGGISYVVHVLAQAKFDAVVQIENLMREELQSD
tara:strand:- start:150 stop:536 length:387 start_codon:yes stop_codon:yes gene_type:complete